MTAAPTDDPKVGEVLSSTAIADHRESWMAWRGDPEHGGECSCPECLSADTVASICDSHEALRTRLSEAEVRIEACKPVVDRMERMLSAGPECCCSMEGGVHSCGYTEALRELEAARAALTGESDD